MVSGSSPEVILGTPIEPGLIKLPIDYASLLNEHGFSTDTDFSDTVTAFDYEINGVLFDEDSPFELEQSETTRKHDILDNLVCSRLVLKSGENLSRAPEYLMSKWYQWLRQSDPVLENFEFLKMENGLLCRILTISEQTACTFRFEIIQGS